MVSTTQINKLVNRLLPYFMNLDLMERRQAGYESLEEQRAGNMRARAAQEFLDKLSVLPPMEQHRARIFQAQAAGQDVTPLVNAMRDDAMRISEVAYTTATGKEWTQDLALAAAELLTDETLRSWVTSAGTTARQQQRIEQVDIPAQEIRREELGVSRSELGVKQGELAYKWANLNFEQFKDRKSVV